MKPLWLDRAIITLDPIYTLCTKPAQFTQILNDMKVPVAQRPTFADKGACVHWLENGTTGDQIAVVCINVRLDKNPIQMASLLVHEAVHLWQQKRDDMAEKEPSSEFEAYAIQTISQNLMYEFARQVTSAKPRRSGRAVKRTRRTGR